MTDTRGPESARETAGFAPADDRCALQRSDEGRILTGVCAGLGRHTGMDPVIFRVGFGVLVVGSGIGIMLYVAAFLLMRNMDGGPAYIEQWSRRVFDAETVLALLAAIFGLGLVINLAAGGIDTPMVVVGTLFAIALLTAHARGADLLALAKSLPERLKSGRGAEPMPEFFPGGSPGTRPVTWPAEAPTGDEPAYRPLAELARAARRAGFDSSGAPFAPHGPYAARGPYDSGPYGSGAPYGPFDRDQGRPPAPARSRRPRSFIGALTMFAAFVAGGIMLATQSSPSTLGLPPAGGVVLITIGAGLLVATWFGRGAGLVAAGTIVSILLVTGAAVNGIPKKIGSYTWEPADSSQTVRTYRLGIGDGTLDLRATKFAPGSRTRFDASVSIGELKVIVPPTARVEVSGSTGFGDVKIEHSVQGGTDVRHVKVLEPDVPPSGGTAPVIELHVKAGIGDIEVRRAA